MTTKKTTAPKAMPKACPPTERPPVQIPRDIFSRHFDGLMTAQRLALAIHRMSASGSCINTPEALIAWEIFSAVHYAVDELGHAAGYSIDEREPE